jgi:hypothetical protein
MAEEGKIAGLPAAVWNPDPTDRNPALRRAVLTALTFVVLWGAAKFGLDLNEQDQFFLGLMLIPASAVVTGWLARALAFAPATIAAMLQAIRDRGSVPTVSTK